MLPLESRGFDSDDEEWFTWWLEELRQLGFIDFYGLGETMELQKSPRLYREIQMKTKVKWDDVQLFDNVEYTPDRIVCWNKKAHGIFFKEFYPDSYGNARVYKEENHEAFFMATKAGDHWVSVLDVKPPRVGKGVSNRGTFFLRQHICWKNLGIYVQKTVLYPSTKVKEDGTRSFTKNHLFPTTFTPRLYLFTKTGKVRTIRFPIRTAEEYIRL